MENLKVKIQDGKIVGRAPSRFEEGTELEVCLVAPELSSSEPELITDQNRRHYHPGTNDNMHGGWGTHLRSVMRAPGGELWFVHDQGETVSRNSSLRYCQRLDSTWLEVGHNNLDALGGRVQQNMAHVLVGHYIYSYGVDVDRRRLVECRLNTITPSHRSCHDIQVSGRPFTTPPNSNYIGAAVSPDGYRLIWWTSVGNPGSLHHMWNFGSGWNGPVSSPIIIQGNHYDYAGYARVIFTSKNMVDMVAQVGIGNDFFVAAHVHLTISGDLSPATFTWLGPQVQAMTPQDIWADESGGLHGLVTLPVGSTYFYKPADGDWSFQRTLEGLHRARFQFNKHSQILRLLGNDGEAILLRSKSVLGHSGALDFESFHSSILTTPEGFVPAALSGMYNMSRSYQTTDVVGLHFAVVGEHPANDHRIYYYGVEAAG